MNMLAGTLSRYMAKRFLFAILGVYLGCAMLIFLIDLVEMLRRAATVDDVGLGTLMTMSAFRTPSFAEQALPFAVLIGSISVLLNLSRRNELTVARGTGVSVWQFLAPGVLVTGLIGIFAVAVYNPVSGHLREIEERMESDVFGTSARSALVSGKTGVWLQQNGADGRTVMNAKRAHDNGADLEGVTVYAYDGNGQFIERIEAKRALLRDNSWDLQQAWVTTTRSEPRFYQSYLISTYLSREQIQRSVADPENLSIWDLPTYIDLSRRAGLETTPYLFQLHVLLSRPLALVAMLVIAATVSLRVFRLGNIGRQIIFGIAMGFLFFVATKILGDLGISGVVAPATAAWVPVIVVMLAGLTILLYQEDG